MKYVEKKTFCLIMGMFLLLTAPVFAQADRQNWDTLSAKGNLTDSISLLMDISFRIGDNVSDLYYQHGEVGIGFLFNGWLEVQPGYRLVSREDLTSEDGNWFVEHVALAEIGQETVQYVSNINKYYIAFTLAIDVMEKRGKNQSLASGPNSGT